jgi:diadenosine tetraphosphate (Ap4A) HIT family hydrolase
VSLDHLWAGWRSSYVSSFEDAHAVAGVDEGTGDAAAAAGDGSAGAGSDPEGCVFCRIVGSDEPDEVRHVLWTGRYVAALLNAYPYAPGHIMVLPVRHVRDLEELNGEEATELWQGVHDSVAALKAAYRPEGLNLGLNLGRAAGAGIPSHLHVHIVPRWIGDTNFMTAIASVRVLPETLGDSWTKLRATWP